MNNYYTLKDGTDVPNLPTFLGDERFQGASDEDKRGIMQNYVHQMGSVLAEMYPDDRQKQIDEHKKFAKNAYDYFSPSALGYIKEGAKGAALGLAGSFTAGVGFLKDTGVALYDVATDNVPATDWGYAKRYPFFETFGNSIKSWGNYLYRKSPFDGVSPGEGEDMVERFVYDLEYFGSSDLSEKQKIKLLKEQEEEILAYSKKINGEEGYETRSMFSKEDSYLKNLLHSYLRTKDPSVLQAIKNHYLFSEKQKGLDEEKAKLVDYLDNTGQFIASWALDYADAGEVGMDLVSGGIGFVVGKAMKGAKMASKLKKASGALAIGAFGEGSMEYTQADRDGASDSEKWDAFAIGAVAGGLMSGTGGVIGYNAYKQEYILKDLKQRLKNGDNIDKIELSSILDKAGVSSRALAGTTNKVLDSFDGLDLTKKLPENYSKAFEGKDNVLRQEYISRLARSVANGENLDADGKKVWAKVEETIRKVFGDKKLDSGFISDFVSKTAFSVDENLTNAIATGKVKDNSWTISLPAKPDVQLDTSSLDALLAKNNGLTVNSDTGVVDGYVPEIKGTYELVESEELASKTGISLNPNDLQKSAEGASRVKEIAKNLNPSKLQVSDSIDTGAPIIGADGNVVAGNKRLSAINKAYDSKSKRAAEYKAAVVKQAVSLGMDPEKAAQMKRPVLIRRAKELNGLSQADVAAHSNLSENLKVEEYTGTSQQLDQDVQVEQGSDAHFAQLHQRYLEGDQAAAQEALDVLDTVAQAKGVPLSSIKDVFVTDSEGTLVPLSERFNEPQAQYDEATAPNKGSPDTKKKCDSIDELLNSSVKGQNSLFYDFGELDANAINTIKEETGIDLAGYIHTVTGDALAHAHRRHGNAKTESARGQVAIGKSDWRKVHDFVNFFDAVTFVAEKQPKDLNVKVLEFQKDGYVYIAEVRTGRKKLASVSLWKHKKGSKSSRPIMDTKSPSSTSETPPKSTLSLDTDSTKNPESQEKSAENANISPDESFDTNKTSSSAHMALDLPELVSIYKSLTGKYPILDRFMEETKNGAFYPADLKIKLNAETVDFLTKDEKANLTKEAVELFAIKTDYKGSLSELHAFVTNKNNKNDPLTIEFEKVRQPLYEERRAEIKAQGNSPVQIRKTLAHEIGHLIDFLASNKVEAGYMLGHLVDLKMLMDNSMKEASNNKYLAGEIKKELINLSLWWRARGVSFDSLSAESKAYLSSPSELYADAFSVLANAPHLLEEKAPIFYNTFLAYMQSRPAALNKYKNFQDLLRSGSDMLQKERISTIDKMIEQSDAHVKEKPKTLQSWSDWWDKFSVKFLDKWQPIYRQIKRHSDTLPSNYYDEMMNTLKSLDYRNTNHEFYLKTLKAESLDLIRSVGLNITDLSRFMFLMHIKENRSDIGNPMGYTYKTAVDTLAQMEKNNKKQYDALVAAQAKWWDLRKKMVIEPLKNSGVFSEKLMEIIELRSQYTPFVPQESKAKVFDKKIDEMIAKDLGISDDTIKAHIHKQLGFLGEVKSPAETLLAKDLALMDLVLRNNAAKSVVAMLKETDPGLITEATGKDGKLKKETKNVGLITYMQDGNAKAYLVPKTFADGFNSAPDPDAAISAFGRLNNAVKALYTQLAPGFWPVALSRDMGAIHFRIPTENVLSVRNIPILGFVWDILNVVARIPAAWRSVYSNKDVRDMLHKQLVISHRESTGGSGAIESSILRELNAFKIDAGFPSTHEGYSKALDGFAGTLNSLKNFYFSLGQVGERASKIYATDLVMKNKSLSAEAKANIVRMHGGSPDFLAQGTMAKKIDCAFLFFNPIVQGYKSVPDAIARDKMSLWRLGSMVAPSLLYSLACEGSLGEEPLELLASMMGEDSQDLQLMTKSIPLYDRTNYHCIPLGWFDEEQKKVVYLRVPLTEEVRLMRGTMYAGAKGEDFLSMLSSAVSYTGSYLPSVNPILSYAKSLIEYYVFDENPRDNFRNKNVLDEYTFVAGGKDAALALAKKGWNDLGGSMIHTFKDDSLSASERKGLESFLGLPLMSSTFGRFVKVSNQGLTDEARLKSNAFKKEKAPAKKLQTRYSRDILNNNMTPEKWKALDDSFSSRAERQAFATKIKQAQTARNSATYSAFSRLNLSKEGKISVLQKMFKEGSISEEDAINIVYEFNLHK